MHEINVLPIKLTRLVSIRTNFGNCKNVLDKACMENGNIQIRKKFNKVSVNNECTHSCVCLIRLYFSYKN